MLGHKPSIERARAKAQRTRHRRPDERLTKTATKKKTLSITAPEKRGMVIGLIGRIMRENGHLFVRQYAIAIGCLVAAAGCTAFLAWIMRDVIDKIFVQQNRTAIYSLPAIVFVTFAIRGLANFGQAVVLARIGNNIVARYQRRLFAHITELSVDFFAENRSAHLAARINSNVSGIRDTLNLTVTSLARDALTLIFLIFVMIWQDPVLSGIALLAGPPIVLMIGGLARKLRAATRQAIDINARVLASMQEAAQGITTGISAHDRARTVQTAVAPKARAEDLCQPGHIFPVMAQPGGVLTRAGHTEAGCDLARLAGLEPAATIVEILNDDGSMARRPDLERFSREHNVRIGTIADLIRYRLEKERFVERIAERDVKTHYGDFRLYCYDDQVSRSVHVALVKGDVTGESNPLVRVHTQDTLGDVLGVEGPGLGWPFSSAVERIAQEPSGIVVLLREQESSRELMDAVNGLEVQADELRKQRSGESVLRTYGVGAQILKDLGVQRMRVLSAPKQMYAISGFDLEISEYVDQ